MGSRRCSPLTELAPPRTAAHRHQWLRDGRLMDVCTTCPAARPRSRVAQVFSMLAFGLGLLALFGMIARISFSDGRVALASCSGSAVHHAYSKSPGAGC